MNPARPQSKLLEIYQKFEPLAHLYAQKIFAYERVSLEQDDVVQEFRIKVYTSIVAYAEKYNRFRETGRGKPVNSVEHYVRSALNNYVVDYIRKIQKTIPASFSIEADSFDYSEQNTYESLIGLNRRRPVCEINGVDILEGLQGQRRKAFVLFLKGHHLQTIEKLFDFDVQKLVQSQRAKLVTKKKELVHCLNHTYTVYKLQAEAD